MMTLGELLDLVAGRVTLVLELKSHFDGDTRLPHRVAEVVQSYPGPVAAMSFDPWQIGAMQDLAPGLPRGGVAQGLGRKAQAGPQRKRDTLAYLMRGVRSRPHFLAYNVQDLPASGPLLGTLSAGHAAADLDGALGGRPAAVPGAGPIR